MVSEMARTLWHRGPDAEGVWASDDGSIAFGHTRLSIQDLSSDGAQPMRSESGRFVIVFNGEIYNFRALMDELAVLGHRFRGHSDTEVMLAAIEQWGLEPAVRRFVGMFAFALWDDRSRTLSLVRDRVGIKPLYYGAFGDAFAFGSELKALRIAWDGSPAIDRSVLTNYLCLNYVPAPHTIYRDIYKLLPGSILTVRVGSDKVIDTAISAYWRLDTYASPLVDRTSRTYEETVEDLQNILREAVSDRLVADVPVGAFLSGGTDSSVVVALMQELNRDPVRTFSIGFTESDYDEAQWARKVASHLGTEHQELYVTPRDAQSVIPDLPRFYDEPFSDVSQIPTVLVSRFTREHVTVSLSGDGGDELFAGYKRYDLAASLWKSFGWMHPRVRAAASRGLAWMSGSGPGILDNLIRRISQRYGRAGDRRDKLLKASSVIRFDDREGLYRNLISNWTDSRDIAQGERSPPTALPGDSYQWMDELGIYDYAMLTDILMYLPDDILVKLDRASMSCSLEARVPLLDHRVVEFALQMPYGFKRHGGAPKAPLRDVLSNYLPPALIDRPKMGFGVPIGSWIRGTLREWATDMLSPTKLHSDGYLNADTVLRIFREHLSGDRDWSSRLWNVLMFQAWLEGSR